jgi:hypothetical protein
MLGRYLTSALGRDLDAGDDHRSLRAVAWTDEPFTSCVARQGGMALPARATGREDNLAERSGEPAENRREPTMYIGGGLLLLILVIVVIVFLMRR